MKDTKFLLFLMIWAVILAGCQKKNIQPQELAQKIYDTYKPRKYMHFKLTENYLYKGQKDTISTPYEAWLMRVPSDKRLGGWAWIENFYRPYKLYYDLHNLYIIYPTKHKIRKYNKVFKPLITYADWTDIFFKPDWLMRYIVQNPSLVKTYDTVLNSSHYYVLEITQKPKDAYEKLIFRKFIIDKRTLAPVKAFSKTQYAKDELLEWLEFDSVNFNQFDTARFRRQFEHFAKLYPPIPYNPEKPEEIVDLMLKIGSPAPQITGKFVFTGQKFNLSDYKGKVIILDFWYTHCPPCVRAIPELSKLYEQYHDQGLEIFGLNSIDPKNETFFKFIKHIGMKYPPIETVSAVDRTYKIIAYPSIYVIDRQGNIAYIEVGFTPEKFQKLKQKVETLLSTDK